MSKIDETKLLDELKIINKCFRKISDATFNILSELSKTPSSTSNAPTPEPKPTGKWIPAQGAKGPFEMLKDKDTVEYRELKADLDYSDHGLNKKFADGKVGFMWLMPDGETIGRRLKP